MDKQITNTELDAIVNKLRKLQTLYEGALAINSEAEAAAVAAKIQHLLTQYNLTIGDLEINEEEVNPVLRENISGFTFRGIGGKWEMNLTHVLCKHNFCRMVYGDTKHLTVIGRRENVQMVLWLKDTLGRQYVALGTAKFRAELERARADYGSDVRTLGRDTYLRHYLLGATQGLDVKLREQEDAARAADSTYATRVTALTVRNDAAVQAFMDDQYPCLKKRTLNVNQGVGYGAGWRAGYATEIHRPIGDNTARQAARIGLLGR